MIDGIHVILNCLDVEDHPCSICGWTTNKQALFDYRNGEYYKRTRLFLCKKHQRLDEIRDWFAEHPEMLERMKGKNPVEPSSDAAV